MKKEEELPSGYQALEIIFSDYPFFLRAISRDKITPGTEKKKELLKLIEEKDFFSIKQLLMPGVKGRR